MSFNITKSSASFFWLMLGMSICLGMSSQHLHASTVVVPNYVKDIVPNAAVQGQSRLTVYFFKVYDATLITPRGQYSPDQPFALRLAYLRDLMGKDIAERSIDEMRDLGYQDTTLLAQWLVEMEKAFPDIKEGDVLTGVVDDKQHTSFYFNGQKRYTVSDPQFTAAFFDIWLAEGTSQPAMRKALLGE